MSATPTLPMLQQQAAQAIADWRPKPGEAPAEPSRLYRVTVVTDCQHRYEYEAVYANTFEAFDAALERYHHCARIEAKPVAPKPAGDTHA